MAWERFPLLLLVDGRASTRHWMWRSLTRDFGLVEASTGREARARIARRSDLEAMVIENELPDERGLEVAAHLARVHHPLASRTIVLAGASDLKQRSPVEGAILVERDDLRIVLLQLAAWFGAPEQWLIGALRRANRSMVPLRTWPRVIAISAQDRLPRAR
jgi:hypothetical protein